MINNNLTKIITRIEKLEKAVFGSNVGKNVSAPKRAIGRDVDFSLNERFFVKRYIAGKSGPKRFTLLLAYLSKGGVNKNIELSEIKKHWNKMTAKTLLGKFNMFYPNDAKTRGWIDSKEYGTYNLTNEWKNVL